MAWKYPRHRVSNVGVIEIDDVNENFRGVVEEASGELNEHNWAAGSWSNRLTDLADDVGMRAWRNEMLVYPGVASTDAEPRGDVIAPGAFVIEETKTWQPIDDLTLTVDSTGGTLWILASMATRLPWYRDDIQSPGTAAAAQFNRSEYTAFGAMFAVRFNGQVLEQSLVGSGDLTNDKMTTTTYRATPPGCGILSFNSPAPAALHAGIVVEAIVPVSPGQHTIEIVVATPQPSRPKPVAPNPAVTVAWWRKLVNTRQVIILELRR